MDKKKSRKDISISTALNYMYGVLTPIRLVNGILALQKRNVNMTKNLKGAIMPKINQEKFEKAYSLLTESEKNLYKFKQLHFKNHKNINMKALIKVRVNNIDKKPPLYLITPDYKYISSVFTKDKENSFFFDLKDNETDRVYMFFIEIKNGIAYVILEE